MRNRQVSLRPADGATQTPDKTGTGSRWCRADPAETGSKGVCPGFVKASEPQNSLPPELCERVSDPFPDFSVVLYRPSAVC